METLFLLWRSSGILRRAIHPEKSKTQGLKLLSNFINLKKIMSSDTHLDAWFGLPAEVKFCKACVISNKDQTPLWNFHTDKATKKIR